jgi:ribonuclease HII
MMCPMGYICGIDEVGRGPIAGPVTAAAVILHEDFPVDLLDDSKKLSAKKRALLDVMIREQALAWGIGWVSPKSIDEMNILQASLLAMERAYGTMCRTFGIDDAQLLLIDGNTFPHMNHHMAAVIKGDGAVPEIMAASIIAKEARDRWMVRIAERFPQWEFERHKGYPTKRHKALCLSHGISPIHRTSFRISS